MAHIPVPSDLPGIIGPMAFRPETAGPLNALADVLLRGPSDLSAGERETIAAYVSHLNSCWFCCASHSSFAAAQVSGGHDTVEAVKADPSSAPVSDKLSALLVVAGQVQQSGLAVTDEAVSDARTAGATDIDIHDTVLIAAAFCMFNRYVDGLATSSPVEREVFDKMAEAIISDGYTAGGLV